MTDDDQDQPSDSGLEAAGYGRPPKEHRFTKGRSGNPRGRPKKSKAYSDLIKSELEKPVTIRAGGKTRSVPFSQALLMRTSREALEGKKWAIDHYLRLMERHGTVDEPGQKDWDLEKLDDDELERFEQLLVKITCDPDDRGTTPD